MVYESDLVVMVWRVVAELDAGPYGFVAVDAVVPADVAGFKHVERRPRASSTLSVRSTSGSTPRSPHSSPASIDITSDEFGRVTEVSYLGFVHGTMAVLE